MPVTTDVQFKFISDYSLYRVLIKLIVTSIDTFNAF